MKKRLLALALCLVMMTSLLPITAAADSWVDPASGVVVNGIKNGGIYCGDSIFTITLDIPENMSDHTKIETADAEYGDGGKPHNISANNREVKIPYTPDVLTNPSYPSNVIIRLLLTGDELIKIQVAIYNEHNWSPWTSNGDGTHSRTCGNGCVESPQTDFCADNDGDCKCDGCKASMHNWQFKAAGNKLTGTCQHGGEEVSVTLKADSVTLPNSPFNAQLAGEKEFQAAFPNAAISNIRYDYKGSDGVWHKGVDPIPANAKAGTYQAFVQVSNLPRPVETDGVVAMAENQDGAYTAELYVQYTAVDPKVTAQTGDNRPIELMMGSVVVFSALAAAAFILDSKRKYSR